MEHGDLKKIADEVINSSKLDEKLFAAIWAAHGHKDTLTNRADYTANYKRVARMCQGALMVLVDDISLLVSNMEYKDFMEGKRR